MVKRKHEPRQASGHPPQPPKPPPAPPPPAAPAEGDVEGGGAALVEQPAEAVRRLTEELDQLRDQHLRLAADFDNYKKRMQRERTETWARAQAHVVSTILDVLDDLARVATLEASQVQVKDVLDGVQLVERKLVRELEGAGLERVGVAGERFDPHLHEAVTTAPAATADQDHLIASVLQSGYRFGGALLRPARVTVYTWQEGASGDGGASG